MTPKTKQLIQNSLVLLEAILADHPHCYDEHGNPHPVPNLPDDIRILDYHLKRLIEES